MSPVIEASRKTTSTEIEWRGLSIRVVHVDLKAVPLRVFSVTPGGEREITLALNMEQMMSIAVSLDYALQDAREEAMVDQLDGWIPSCPQEYDEGI